MESLTSQRARERKDEMQVKQFKGGTPRYEAEALGRRVCNGERYCPGAVCPLVFYRPDGDEMLVGVRIVGQRNSYGTDHFEIQPINGAGKRWTTRAKLSPVTYA